MAGKKKNQKNVSDSEFHMWRTIFALAHADHVITPEERKFMTQALESLSLSEGQREVLEDDMEWPHDIGEMFLGITDQRDRSRLFYVARLLLWSDGDFDEKEQKILIDLARVHYKTVDVGEMMKRVEMELEDEHRQWITEDVRSGVHRGGITGVLKRFMGRMGS